MSLRYRSALLAALLALVALTSGCSSDDDDALVIYNAQNQNLMKALTKAFTDKTGIAVKIRGGGDSELSNQLVQEGAKSPADVFTTENSTAMAQVDRAGLFAPLSPAALEGVPAQYVSGRKTWVGVAARSTVLVYNPSKLPAAELPASMLDLSQPAWKGRFGYAPTGADFQAIASSVFALEGDAAGEVFVQGLKDNGRTYANNIAILKAVNAGEVPAGIIYHYYWFQDRANAGADSRNAELHYFGGQDAGAYLSVAGAGVLSSSKRSEQAQQFVAFLTSREGQEVLAASNDLQYAINNGVASNPALKPIAELEAPEVPFDRLDGPKVLAAFRKVGIL
ncbi:MAG: extracellular solute-binding protein family 1 [Frankiales bacterium]|nr:extracellular solute-binding protein family 1 [Frankiales bacterium]